MDQNQSGSTFEDSLKEVMQTLPPVIRTYLAQGQYTAVAKSLMTRYGLRIDQGGVLEREIMLLLMGIEDPNEFMRTLAEEAKLDQQTINSIVQEVNERIFVPLRKEEEEQGMGAPEQAAKPVVPASQGQQGAAPSAAPRVMAPSPAAPQPRPAPVAPQAPRPDTSHVAPLPPKRVMPPVLGRAWTAPAQVPPQAMLPVGEEELPARVASPAPRPSAPLPPNLPGALPPAPKAAPTLITSYSTDPYREPIDEPTNRS